MCKGRRKVNLRVHFYQSPSFISAAIAPALQRRVTVDPETYQVVTDGDICARFCSKPRVEADVPQSTLGANEQAAEPRRLFKGRHFDSEIIVLCVR